MKEEAKGKVKKGNACPNCGKETAESGKPCEACQKLMRPRPALFAGQVPPTNGKLI